MTDEEIKKLSEECALHYQGRPSNKGYELSNRLTIESYALMTLKWLSKDFCIVPKSDILADYEFNAGCFAQFSASGDNRNSKIAQWHKGKCDELEWLFGKDMFEEEGE